MKKLILLLIVCFCSGLMHAQISLFDDSTLMKKIDYQVKQVSEFFDRFNFTELAMPERSGLSRKMNMASLIDLKDTSITHNPETIVFLKSVTDDTNLIQLHFGDTNWHAVVHCSFLYQNKTIQADLTLRTEGIAGNGYSWVICSVKSDALQFSDRQNRSAVFINPVNEEVGFTELTKALNKKKDILSYTHSSYQPDLLSAFLLMIQNGDIKLKQINTVDFWFYQVPGWVFAVKNFNRPGFNSGWLITSLKKIKEEDKNKDKTKLNN